MLRIVDAIISAEISTEIYLTDEVLAREVS
jgi:hypothetical protein